MTTMNTECNITDTATEYAGSGLIRYSIDVREAGDARGRWVHQTSSTPEKAAQAAIFAARKDGAVGELYARVYGGYIDTPVGATLLALLKDTDVLPA